MSVVVEFCGIPGSGKSTVCDAVAAELVRTGVVAHQPRARIDTDVPAATRIARKLGLATRALSGARAAWRVARAQDRLGDAPGRALQWLVTQRLIGARAPGVTLLDEGLVQALWSIGLRGDLERFLAGSIRFAVPDVIVVVECAPDEAARRLRARGSEHSRVQRDANLEEALVRGADVLEHILARIGPIAPGARVHRLGQSEDPAAVRRWIQGNEQSAG